MRDSRVDELAIKIVNYSLDVQADEKVIIEYTEESSEFVLALMEQIYKNKAYPFLKRVDYKMQRQIMLNCDDKQLEAMASYEIQRTSEMDCLIAVRANDNLYSLSDVPDEKVEKYTLLYSKKLREARKKGLKWSVLQYPNPLSAHLAEMSNEEYEDFYFNVCNLDYDKMSNAMDVLVDYMKKTDKVRIVAKETDITFSIKDMLVEKSDARTNIPDGEVYCGPVLDSANGIITYNTASYFNNKKFENVCLEFEKGKVVKATSSNTEDINKIFDIDEGARYIGEFAIGLNPYIKKISNSTLFDEKIAGSIHLTPGHGLELVDNNNKSAIHWDLILIQTEECGGGEIYFDDVLVRKDGYFIIDSLKCLNPENLM